MMKPASIYFTVTILLLYFYIVRGVSIIESGLLVKNADQTVDLASQLTKVTNKLLLENSGKSPVHSFLFAIQASQNRSLSVIEGWIREHNQLKLQAQRVQLSKLNTTQIGDIFFEFKLRNPLLPERSISVQVDLVFSYELIPHPKEIIQKEKQLVKWLGNLYIYSPYPVAKQTTTVILPSRNIESFTKIKPFSQSEFTIIYGPYDRQSAFSYEKLTVHFENNNRFLAVTKLERFIEISHWGNIAVEETIDLLHTGALLKGSFSRYEFTRESKNLQPSIQNFDTILPAAASDIYYRDEIGNISTSHIRIKKDWVELNLRPRFPLFGGWKTRYTVGYNLPSYEYLYNAKDQYILSMRLLDHVYDDMIVDNMVVKIILPEGSYAIKIELPYEVSRLPDSLHYTYLDTTGRPVVAVSKTNLVENHIQNFKLKYEFPKWRMLLEPLLVAVAFYLLFLMVIICVRLDFSIDKDDISEGKLRVAGQCEKILTAQDRRVSSYNLLDQLLLNLKANKDLSTYLALIKSVNQEHKIATSAISEIAQKLKGEPGDMYEKTQDLQKFDKILKEVYNQQQSLYVDKLIPGKIGKQPFIEAESAIAKKKEELVEKINSIIKSLQ